MLLLFLLFLTFSALVANPKKLLYTVTNNRFTFGVDRAVWTLAAKMDDGAPWHKGVLQGEEKFMACWHKEEEEASRRRATKRDSRDLEPPTHL